MKKIFVVLLMLGLLAAMTACGENDAPAPAPETSNGTSVSADSAPAEQETPETTQPAAEETPVVIEQPAEEPAEQPEEDADAQEESLLDTALGYVDKEADLLIAAIGEPLEKTYEDSCSGPGDDGIWTYEGLTVFTYLEDGIEIVVDAE